MVETYYTLNHYLSTDDAAMMAYIDIFTNNKMVIEISKLILNIPREDIKIMLDEYFDKLIDSVAQIYTLTLEPIYKELLMHLSDGLFHASIYKRCIK